MARQTYESWLPEEQGSDMLATINRTSVVESVARRVPMTTPTRTFPRSGEADIDIIPKGSAYGEDVSDTSEVVLTVKKFGRAARIAEEDIDDTIIDVIADKKRQFGNAYAKKLDNACLGTSAAVGTNVPFVSVYRAVRTADADVDYVADTNHRFVNRALAYDDFADFIGRGEEGELFDASGAVIIAHTSFRNVWRKLKNDNGDPIFAQGDMTQGQPDRLFGYPVRWSVGAVVTPTATAQLPAAVASDTGAVGTAGNRLMILATPESMLLGVRSGPESVVIDGRDGLSALTDETILKMRARRAFAVGYPQAFQVLEYQPDVP